MKREITNEDLAIIDTATRQLKWYGEWRRVGSEFLHPPTLELVRVLEELQGRLRDETRGRDG